MKFLFFFCILFSGLLMASDLVEMNPVTQDILALYFDDGYVIHHGLGQSGNDDELKRSPLSITRAMKIDSYTISSQDDEHYTTALHPANVGRKTKGKDFTQDWGQQLPYVNEHWIYLEMPHAMQAGKTYEITLNHVAKNGDTFYFTFDEKQTRSETIHVNQIGYAPDSPNKFAYLSHWAGDLGPVNLDAYDGMDFHLITANEGEIVYSKAIELRKRLAAGPDCGYPDHAPHGSYTGADVWLLDFSDFVTPGEYKIMIENLGCSYPFRIDDDVYREAFYTTIRALYHQRCGIALEAPYTEYTRDRCHHPAETDTVVLSDWRYMDGRNAFTQLPENATDEKRPFVGGWHDAADWDKHHFHMRASRYLLMAYELRPDVFSDDELNIPESDNGIPDIIDEAKWCIDLYKRMQEEDGGVHGGIETHRHPGNGISCVTDTDQWYAYAPDPIASMHYAASAAQLAFCLDKAGFPEFFDDYVESAKKAFEWALDDALTSDWDEMQFRDMRHLASAWLFKVTGEQEYHDYFKQDNMITSDNTELEKWQSHDQQWGVWTYITTEQATIDDDLKTRLENATLAWAKSDHMNNADKRGYQYGNDWWYPIAWGQATRPRVFPVYMAYYVTGDEKYLGYHYTTVDYVLGANPLNMCWVTGLGEKSPKEIMHIDSWFYNVDKAPVPGFIPYGPSAYTDDNPDGPWEVSWGLKTTYPHASEWPSHELWFENRYCPPVAEFTVHEMIAPAAAAFGLLCAPGGKFNSSVRDIQHVPGAFQLGENYPNPFNPQTTIQFYIEKQAQVTLEVFDVLGRHVQTLLKNQMMRGEQQVQWNGRNHLGQQVAGGVYFYRVIVNQQGGKFIKTSKMVLVK